MLGLIAATAAAPVLVSLPNLPEFPKPGEGKVYEWTEIEPGAPWDELVLSWNVKNGAGTTIKFEAQVVRGESRTGWYTLATWSPDDPTVRRSVEGQSDSEGQVLTDTLQLRRPGGTLRLRAYMTRLAEAPAAKLSLVTVSFALREFSGETEPYRPAWGKVLEVFPRSQMSYPNGNILCSPTSVSMLLRFWADSLRRTDLDRDVPDVQAGAIDAGDPKQGNWSFSMAYAGSLEPLTAYVSRFRGVSDLERWIAAGIPVACSVDYTLLQGKTGPKSGHLVVLIGFTNEGEPVFNDPGWSREVRQIYRRGDFERAWAASNRTVYLVYPAGTKTPPIPGPWIP